MGAPDILALLAASGLTIRPLPGGLLEVAPRDRLTDDLRALIRSHRSEILAALGAPSPQPRPSTDPDRPAKLAELHRLIHALAEHDPEHWTPADVEEAIREGERDLDAALETWRAIARQHGIGMDTDARAEARRQRVLAMLAERPGIRYALVSDPDDPAYPELVVLAVGLRKEDGATYTFEMLVPHDRYDPFLLMELVERHGGTLH